MQFPPDTYVKVPNMKLCDALVKAFDAFGVRYVFGVSGANIEHLHDSIHRLGQGRVISVMSKCESGASFMADAYARVHRELGVCCSTSGGGMLNLLPGLAESFAESVPVLAIVGQAPRALEGRGAFQDSSGKNHSVMGLELFHSLSKFVSRIDTPDQFWPVFTEAIFAALSGRPGPSVLLIPRDLYDEKVSEVDPAWASTLKARLRMSGRNCDEGARILHEALQKAQNPVLIIGHGVRRSNQSRSVQNFAQRSNIPVAATLSARAEYDNELLNYMGMVGVAGHPSVHAWIAEHADLLVVVGSGLDIMNRGPIGAAIEKTRSIFINVDEDPITSSFPSAEILLGDAGDFFEALEAQCRSKPLRFNGLAQYQRQMYAPALAKPAEGVSSGPGTLLQSRAIELLKRALPTNGHLVFDAGNCAAAALHYTWVPSGTTSTIALGMGGMGYAIGGAIGAQIGSSPHSRTLAFVGDGAFLMSGMEVHTAVELGLPVLYVVFNNHMHGMCVTRQQLFFEGRVECAVYRDADLATLARGFGPTSHLWVGQASSEESLSRQIDDYLEHSHLPGVLELKISHEEVPPFVPFLPKDAPLMSA